MTGEVTQPVEHTPRHVVVMGVSGCGKTTVAREIALATGMVFAEADEFHSEANVAKMRAGNALDDFDRRPWLESLAAWMKAEDHRGRSTFVACSALRRAYRDVLRAGPPALDFVHLDGPVEVLHERMAAREGHYMPVSLLGSQLDTLEPLQPDESGIVLDLREPPRELLSRAVTWLRR
jgi:gluconokinase